MNFYTDYDRYTFADEMDFFYHDDGTHSAARRKEMDLRRYAGLDTYCGDYEDFYGDFYAPLERQVQRAEMVL